MIPFRLGLGGKLGSGRHWFSWISLADEIGAFEFLLEHDELSGPVNLTAPAPVTNAEFTRALGAAMRRPTLFTVPPIALWLVFGRALAEELLLVSQRVVPVKLQQAGYEFEDPQIEPALRRMLA